MKTFAISLRKRNCCNYTTSYASDERGQKEHAQKFTYIYQKCYPRHSRMHSDRVYLDCTKLLVARNPISVIVFRSW